jgi:hypothetical protein
MFRFKPQAASVPAVDVSMNSRRRMKSYLPLARGGAVVAFLVLSLITISVCHVSSGVHKKDSRPLASAIQSKDWGSLVWRLSRLDNPIQVLSGADFAGY